MKSFTYTLMNLVFRVMAQRFFLPVLLVLLLAGMEATSQTTVVKVRFNNPVYSCTTQGYCLDVEFQSNVPDQKLFGMNVRFMYDDAVLEFVRLTDFQGGYDTISVPKPITGSPESGALWGFSGPMEFFNGIVELVDKSPSEYIPISTTGWTKLFSVCFKVDNMEAFTQAGFCPSVVWDLELNPADGGFLVGDNGVVISVLNPAGPTESAPVQEEVVQFNWAYDGTSAPPFGAPLPTVCVPGDIVPPVILTQAVSGDLGCNPVLVVAPVFTATDNCDPLVVPVVTTTGPANTGCNYTQTWTAEATDASGNVASPVSITYTWKVDEIKPVISTQAVNHDLGCNPGVIMPPAFMGSDNCEGMIIPVVSTSGAANTGCAYSQTWTANYTDQCGNVADPVSITYTWKQNTLPPVISTTDTSHDLGCNPDLIALPLFTATDNCGGTGIPQVSTAGPTNTGCSFSQTWTANYTDDCGNVALPVSITYTWTQDTEKPLITTTATNHDLGTNPVVVAPVFTATDNCTALVVPDVTTAGPTHEGCAWSQTWTANATDGCLNTAVPVSITYTWTVDAGLPVISTTAQSANLGCNPTVVPPVFTGTDNCGGAFTPVVTTSGPVNTGCSFGQTWTANFTDNSGNQAVPVSITYSWTEDTTVPVLTTQAIDQTNLGCNPVVIAPVFTGTDNCEGTILPVVTTTGPVNTGGCAWSQTWTANYTDGCLNAAVPVSITYFWTQDTQKPVISTTAKSMDMGCNPTVVPPVFTVNDNCSGAALPTVMTAGPVNTGCAYSQTWTAVYKDACNNEADPVSIIYTWIQDTEKPVISTESTSHNLGINPVVVAPVFTALDNCAGTLVPVVTTAGPTNTLCSWSQTWTANITDGCGNAAVPVSITYTWTMMEGAPVINTTAVGGDLGCNPTVINEPVFTVSDNCGGIFTPVVTTEQTNNGCMVTKKWTATYTDGAGHSAVPVSITYTWKVDVTAPVLSTTAVNKDLGCNPQVVAPVFTGTDNCQGTIIPVVTTAGPVNTGGCLWAQTWTASFTDACGNAAQPVSITYTWKQDVIPPDLAVPMDRTIQAGENCQYDANPDITGWAVVSDNCTVTPTLDYSDVETAGSLAGTRLLTRTWVVTDDCGNKTSKVQKITVVGGSGPPDLVLHDHCVYLSEYGKWTLNRWDKEQMTAGSTGGCGTLTKLTFTFEPQSFNCNHAGKHVPVVVTAADELGNTATGTVHVLVLDTISPVAVCKDITVTLDSYNQAFILPGMIDNGSYDNCSVSKLALDKQLFNQFDAGKVVPVMLVAFDPSGNTGTCQANVTVRPKATVVVTVNQAPTIADVAEVKIVNEPLSLDIPLSNITPGGDEAQKVTLVSAVCDNPGLISGLEVVYVPGESTGKLKVNIASAVSGSTIVTVTVKDDGGTANGGVDTTVKTFRISVENSGTTVNVTVFDEAGIAAVTSVLNVGEEFMAKLWPNPTSGKVNIDLNWNDIQKVEVSVFNVLGVKVLTRQFNSGDQIQFDLSGRASGIYMVKINAEGHSLVKKVTLDRR